MKTKSVEMRGLKRDIVGRTVRRESHAPFPGGAADRFAHSAGPYHSTVAQLPRTYRDLPRVFFLAGLLGAAARARASGVQNKHASCRAWVVDKRPLWEVSWGLLAGLVEPSAFGGASGGLWGEYSGSSGGFLQASWGPAGGLAGLLGGRARNVWSGSPSWAPTVKALK